MSEEFIKVWCEFCNEELEITRDEEGNATWESHDHDEDEDEDEEEENK